MRMLPERMSALVTIEDPWTLTSRRGHPAARSGGVLSAGVVDVRPTWGVDGVCAGDAGEEEVEASVEFAGPVIVSEVGGQAPQDRELPRRQLM